MVEMDETVKSANVPDMAETDVDMKICEVTDLVEISKTAGRVDDIATNLNEMADLVEKEDEREDKPPRKKARTFCQQISSACIPRLKTFCFGEIIS